MSNSTYTRVVGIAKEVTVGTPVLPTDYLTIHTDPKPVITQMYLDDKGWRGSATLDYGKVLGPRHAEFNIAGDLDAGTIGYPLQSILGDVATTGSVAPFTSVLSLLNSGAQQPAGYTITEFDGAVNRPYPAARASDVTIQFTQSGLLTYTSKFTAWAPPSTNTTPLVTSFGGTPPTAVWQGIAQIAGAPTAVILDGSVDFKRTVSIVNSVSGSADPYKLWSGPLAVSGKFTAMYEDQALLTAYLTNTQPALDIKWAQNAASSIQLHITKCAYTMASVDGSKDYGTIGVTFSGVATQADAGASAGYSPIKVTLVNSKAAATYL